MEDPATKSKLARASHASHVSQPQHALLASRRRRKRGPQGSPRRTFSRRNNGPPSLAPMRSPVVLTSPDRSTIHNLEAFARGDRYCAVAGQAVQRLVYL